MSSRTGQRGTSVATSQRKHRSRSTTRYDLEKKQKKKDMRTSGTTSLVSIPNSIKLTMLNSGLISFGESIVYSLCVLRGLWHSYSHVSFRSYEVRHTVFKNIKYLYFIALCTFLSIKLNLVIIRA